MKIYILEQFVPVKMLEAEVKHLKEEGYFEIAEDVKKEIVKAYQSEDNGVWEKLEVNTDIDSFNLTNLHSRFYSKYRIVEAEETDNFNYKIIKVVK